MRLHEILMNFQGVIAPIFNAKGICCANSIRVPETKQWRKPAGMYGILFHQFKQLPCNLVAESQSASSDMIDTLRRPFL